jgi:hypothetical protein
MFSFFSKHLTRPLFLNARSLRRDTELFYKTVCTRLDTALKELEVRRQDQQLEKRIFALLHDDIPEPLQKAPKAVMFRQITVANYENRRFLNLVDASDAIEPLFWEYWDDKYTPNELKRPWGKLHFYHGKGKNGGDKIEHLNIIDFNLSNGKKIQEVRTLWGERLLDFHHALLKENLKVLNPSIFYDASKWFSRQGARAKNYYESFLTLFVRHGILFEDFMLEGKESEFIHDVFVPAFLSAWQKTGHKPLIVNLAAPRIEGQQFWYFHPASDKTFLEERIKKQESRMLNNEMI